MGGYKVRLLSRSRATGIHILRERNTMAEIMEISIQLHEPSCRKAGKGQGDTELRLRTRHPQEFHRIEMCVSDCHSVFSMSHFKVQFIKLERSLLFPMMGVAMYTGWDGTAMLTHEISSC